VIRSILLPVSMKLLGEANWYLPSWLRWLPEIKMAEQLRAARLDCGGIAARREAPPVRA
jgi:uncharacterized membrane protein YdfJ with MMPL/SSD domain